MTEEQYRQLVVDFDKIAKRCTEIIPEDYVSDKMALFYHIRYACHLLRDIRMQLDMRENPTKVYAEYTPKKPTELKDATPD